MIRSSGQGSAITGSIGLLVAEATFTSTLIDRSVSPRSQRENAKNCSMLCLLCRQAYATWPRPTTKHDEARLASLHLHAHTDPQNSTRLGIQMWSVKCSLESHVACRMRMHMVLFWSVPDAARDHRHIAHYHHHPSHRCRQPGPSLLINARFVLRRTSESRLFPITTGSSSTTLLATMCIYLEEASRVPMWVSQKRSTAVYTTLISWTPSAGSPATKPHRRYHGQFSR